jgi:hypothetical protein
VAQRRRQPRSRRLSLAQRVEPIPFPPPDVTSRVMYVMNARVLRSLVRRRSWVVSDDTEDAALSREEGGMGARQNRHGEHLRGIPPISPALGFVATCLLGTRPSTVSGSGSPERCIRLPWPSPTANRRFAARQRYGWGHRDTMHTTVVYGAAPQANNQRVDFDSWRSIPSCAIADPRKRINIRCAENVRSLNRPKFHEVFTNTSSSHCVLSKRQPGSMPAQHQRSRNGVGALGPARSRRCGLSVQLPRQRTTFGRTVAIFVYCPAPLHKR